MTHFAPARPSSRRTSQTMAEPRSKPREEFRAIGREYQQAGPPVTRPQDEPFLPGLDLDEPDRVLGERPRPDRQGPAVGGECDEAAILMREADLPTQHAGFDVPDVDPIPGGRGERAAVGAEGGPPQRGASRLRVPFLRRPSIDPEPAQLAPVSALKRITFPSVVAASSKDVFGRNCIAATGAKTARLPSAGMVHRTRPVSGSTPVRGHRLDPSWDSSTTIRPSIVGTAW